MKTSQGLWVANGANVVEFLPEQLLEGKSDPRPHVAIDSPAFGAPQGVVFDARGNLWVVDGGTRTAGGTIAPALYEFSAGQLAALGTVGNPLPKVTIRAPGFTFPQQAIFDRKGNLWVTDNGSDAVFVFTRQQLASTSQNAKPWITIQSTVVLRGASGIAFDAAGDLFVANSCGTAIERFHAGALPTTGGVYKLAPGAVISDDGAGSIQSPWALAFDGEGRLWSSNAGAPFSLVAFTPEQLAAGGRPQPAVTLASAAIQSDPTLAAPDGIAFDKEGDLTAASSAAPFGIAGYARADLIQRAATAPAAATLLVGNATTLSAPAGIAFGPAVL